MTAMQSDNEAILKMPQVDPRWDVCQTAFSLFCKLLSVALDPEKRKEALKECEEWLNRNYESWDFHDRENLPACSENWKSNGDYLDNKSTNAKEAFEKGCNAIDSLYSLPLEDFKDPKLQFYQKTFTHFCDLLSKAPNTSEISRIQYNEMYEYFFLIEWWIRYGEDEFSPSEEDHSKDLKQQIEKYGGEIKEDFESLFKDVQPQTSIHLKYLQQINKAFKILFDATQNQALEHLQKKIARTCFI